MSSASSPVPSHITRYDLMPIPPVPEQTEYFVAGAVTFGVEYRLLTDAIAAASDIEAASGADSAGESFDDSGVALHVFGTEPGAEGADAEGRVEYLRFDCFNEDPHYHYVSWRDRSNEMLHLDPVADGDPLAWALERIRTRLPQMLTGAGGRDLAARVDARLVEAVLPRVSEAAWRARYHHDEASVLAGALASGPGESR
jgi:hypothetical protein